VGEDETWRVAAATNNTFDPITDLLSIGIPGLAFCHCKVHTHLPGYIQCLVILALAAAISSMAIKVAIRGGVCQLITRSIFALLVVVAG
jgi:hypothetical protein